MLRISTVKIEFVLFDVHIDILDRLCGVLLCDVSQLHLTQSLTGCSAHNW